LQGELRNLKPPSFEGEREREDDVEAWLLGLRRYFQLHNYSSNLESRISTYHLHGKDAMWGDQLKKVEHVNENRITWKRLGKHHVVLDCHNKTFTCLDGNGKQIIVKGVPRPISIRDISSLQLKKCFRKGCQLYEAHVEEPDNTKGPNLEDFSVLWEFEDVFQEIPRFTPRREIDFSIHLVPGVAPVSKPPYRMSTPELKELQIHLEEFLKKGYIRPSVSPWGASVLFVKKKDRTLRLCIEFR
jgi:hypothetical protein